MVDSTPGSTADWPTFALGGIVQQAEISREEGKYCFIWDKTGNVPMFYKYKGQLVDLAPKIVSKTMGKETNETIAEYLRKQLVVGQRTGDNILFDIGKLKPSWTDLTVNGVFEPNLTFDRTEWFK